MKNEQTNHEFKSQGWFRPLIFLGTTTIVLAGLYFGGVWPRLSHQKELKAETLQAAIPTVNVEKISFNQAPVRISLPSTTEAFQDTVIYARANGYVKSFQADIGSKVKAGDTLATIETPELDEQLRQAQAKLSLAQSNLVLAQSSLTRWQDLQKDNAVSQQEVDERNNAFSAAKAEVEAAKANAERLTHLQAYQKVIAPYSGTIVERNVDRGDLITGDSNEATRRLFRLVQTDELRVFVQVPQTHYRSIREGIVAELQFREWPGRKFEGRVVRMSGALDANTRTLRTEIEVDNSKGELLPGLYAEVNFQLENAAPVAVVPSRSIITDSRGTFIALVDQGGNVKLQPVSIGRDLGDTVEIRDGLGEGDLMITNPNDTLQNGSVVKYEKPQEIAPRKAVASIEK